MSGKSFGALGRSEVERILLNPEHSLPRKASPVRFVTVSWVSLERSTPSTG